MKNIKDLRILAPKINNELIELNVNP